MANALKPDLTLQWTNDRNNEKHEKCLGCVANFNAFQNKKRLLFEPEK